MEPKSLHNSDENPSTKNVPDIAFFGARDTWQLICKASSEAEGWMKSTKAMQLPGGVLVQVTTQQRDRHGGYALAEALTFVPGVTIVADCDSDHQVVGRRFMPVSL